MTVFKSKIKNSFPDLNRHRIKQYTARGLISIFRMVMLISVSYIILYPLFAMFAFSVMSTNDIMDSSVTWITKDFTFDNFKSVWTALDYPSSLLNTVLVGGVSAFLEIFSCAIAAYGFSRFKFKGKNLLFGLVLVTAIVPVQILVIPLYLNYSFFDVFGILGAISDWFGIGQGYIDITDTPLTFWLPSVFGVGLRSGLFIFIYRQFFMGLPKELEEAAAMDGCGPLRTFFKIIIPSAGVVFLTVTIFAVIWHWNEYYQSVIFFNTQFPLSVKLSNIITELRILGISQDFAAPYVSAACLLFILPVLIMYLFLQKKFIQSVDRVGIVG